ncbi:MAG: TetR/AcrR family transcriptional regulator [Actinomycetota bacterium]
MATTTGRTRMPANERKRQIVLAARDVFGRAGYEDASVDQLAARAGVTKPILYRHFDGKRDLYLAVLEDHLGDLIRRLWVGLSASTEPRERLRESLHAYFEFVEQRPDGYRMLAEAGTRMDPDTRERLGTAWDTLAEGVARMVGDILRASGLDESGAPVYARALVGMAQGVADWWVRTPRLPREALADYLLALTWRGFDGLPRHPTPFRPPREAVAPA